MLVLTRKEGESIAIGPSVISINWIRGNRVSLGIVADQKLKILRLELQPNLQPAQESEGSGEPRAA